MQLLSTQSICGIRVLEWGVFPPSFFLVLNLNFGCEPRCTHRCDLCVFWNSHRCDLWSEPPWTLLKPPWLLPCFSLQNIYHSWRRPPMLLPILHFLECVDFLGCNSQIWCDMTYKCKWMFRQLTAWLIVKDMRIKFLDGGTKLVIQRSFCSMPFAISGSLLCGSEESAKPRHEEYDVLHSSKENHTQLCIANQERESRVSTLTRDLVRKIYVKLASA